MRNRQIYTSDEAPRHRVHLKPVKVRGQAAVVPVFGAGDLRLEGVVSCVAGPGLKALLVLGPGLGKLPLKSNLVTVTVLRM